MERLREPGRRSIILRALGLFVGQTILSAPACALESKKLEPVRIASSQGNQAATLQQLMETQGYFDEFDLEPDIAALGDGTKLIDALMSGGSDIAAMAGFTQALSAIEKGAPLKIISAANSKSQEAVFSAKPKIGSVRDLAGKTIGVGALGAQLHQAMVAILIKSGVELSKVRFVSIGSSADVFRAVVAGTVDAGPAEADVLSQIGKYGVHRLEGGSFADDLPEYTWQASFAMNKVIDDKRDLLVRVLAAYGKAFRFVQDDPNSKSAFIEARWKALGGSDFKTVAAAAARQWQFVQDNKPYELDLLISPERVADMQRINVEVGTQRRVLPYDQVADMSLAADAIRLIG